MGHFSVGKFHVQSVATGAEWVGWASFWLLLLYFFFFFFFFMFALRQEKKKLGKLVVPIALTLARRAGKHLFDLHERITGHALQAILAPKVGIERCSSGLRSSNGGHLGLALRVLFVGHDLKERTVEMTQFLQTAAILDQSTLDLHGGPETEDKVGAPASFRYGVPGIVGVLRHAVVGVGEKDQRGQEARPLGAKSGHMFPHGPEVGGERAKLAIKDQLVIQAGRGEAAHGKTDLKACRHRVAIQPELDVHKRVAFPPLVGAVPSFDVDSPGVEGLHHQGAPRGEREGLLSLLFGNVPHAFG